MTTARVTTRLYDPESGELVKETEVEVTTPDPTKPAPPAPANPAAGFALPRVTGCGPNCLGCAREAREAREARAREVRERLSETARNFGFQVRYSPPGPIWRYHTMTTPRSAADAVARLFL